MNLSTANKKTSNILLIIGSLILLVFRLIGQYLYFNSSTSQFFAVKLINITTSILFLIAIIYLLYKNNFFSLKPNYSIIYRDFFILSFRFLLLVLVLLLLSYLPNTNYFKILGTAFRNVAYSIFAISGVLIIIIIYSLLHVLHHVEKTNYYRKFYFLFLSSTFALFLLYFLDYLGFSISNSLENFHFGDIIQIILGSSILISSLIIPGKNHWINDLNQNEKIKTIVLSLLISIPSLFLTYQLYSPFSIIFNIFNGFITGSQIISSAILFSVAIANLRIISKILISIPNDDIIKKKSAEIISLQFLNKIAAESLDKDDSYLYENVLNLSALATKSSAAWLELYNDNSITVIAHYNIKPTTVQKIHTNHTLLVEFKKILKPFHFGKLSNYPTIYNAMQELPYDDLLILPLYVSNLRVGSLINIHFDAHYFDNHALELLTAFSNNIKIAMENRKLLADSFEKERLKNELVLATNMQYRMLPQKMPQIEGVSIAAYYSPAVEIGGDYYDFIKLSDGRHCIICADVSGKGISAAFYVAHIKGTVLTAANECISPAQLLKKINLAMFGYMERNMFITMIAIAISTTNDSISVARAGHTPLYMIHNGEVKTIVPKGIGIGLCSSNTFDISIDEGEHPFPSGSKLLLLSDGILELRNIDKQEFGEKNVINFLNNDPSNDAEILLNSFINETKLFSGNIPPHDDITAIALIKI